MTTPTGPAAVFAGVGGIPSAREAAGADARRPSAAVCRGEGRPLLCGGTASPPHTPACAAALAPPLPRLPLRAPTHPTCTLPLRRSCRCRCSALPRLPQGYGDLEGDYQMVLQQAADAAAVQLDGSATKRQKLVTPRGGGGGGTGLKAGGLTPRDVFDDLGTPTAAGGIGAAAGAGLAAGLASDSAVDVDMAVGGGQPGSPPLTGPRTEAGAFGAPQVGGRAGGGVGTAHLECRMALTKVSCNLQSISPQPCTPPLPGSACLLGAGAARHPHPRPRHSAGSGRRRGRGRRQHASHPHDCHW